MRRRQLDRPSSIRREDISQGQWQFYVNRVPATRQLPVLVTAARSANQFFENKTHGSSSRAVTIPPLPELGVGLYRPQCPLNWMNRQSCLRYRRCNPHEIPAFAGMTVQGVSRTWDRHCKYSKSDTTSLHQLQHGPTAPQLGGLFKLPAMPVVGDYHDRTTE